MALIKCPECGKEVSDKEDKCPNCGCPIEHFVKDEVSEENIVNKEEITEVENKNDTKKFEFNKNKKIGIGIIVAVLCVAVVGFVATNDSRTYNSAMTAYENEEYQEALDKFTKVEDYKDASKMVKKCEFQLSTDGRFIQAVGDALEARWSSNDSVKFNGSMNATIDPKIYGALCKIELEYLKPFKDEVFQDEIIKKEAKQYIEYVQSEKAATDKATMNYAAFLSEWSEAYAGRVILLKKFTDDYDLKVNDVTQPMLDFMMTDAASVREQNEVTSKIHEMTEQFKVTETTDAWGFPTYEVNATNTTDRSFDLFYLEVNALDANGGIISSGTSSTVNTWAPGQSAKFEVFLSNPSSENIAKFVCKPHYTSGPYTE